MDRDQQAQVAMHRWTVIAEATNGLSTPAERGIAVRAVAERPTRIPTGRRGGIRGERSTAGCGPGGPAGWTR